MPNILEHEYESMIYLDNEATSWPKPESVYRAMDEFLREKGGNLGHGRHNMALAAREAVEETRLLIAGLINAQEKERITFILNCTHALNLELKGLLRPGDHVIISSIKHNSVMRPLRKLEQQGVRVTQLAPSPETGVVSACAIEEAVVKGTRLLALTDAQM